MNKITVSLSEAKNIMMDIMIEFSEFCDVHNLRYSLYAGTALGAVRHNGFIPWDDDIDIGMPRVDFEYLLNHWKNEKYILKKPFSKGCLYPFAKIVDKNTKSYNIYMKDKFGIWIDIFPFDYLEKEKVSLYEHYHSKVLGLLYRKRLRHLFSFIFKSNNFKSGSLFKITLRGIICFTRFFKFKFYPLKAIRNLYYKYLNSIYSSHSIGECSFTVLVFGPDLFDRLIDVKFENSYFKLFNDYDSVLKQLYGNYMELPPLEKRYSHVDYTFYKK